jgi:methyltransferase (TIGR00027 family)
MRGVGAFRNPERRYDMDTMERIETAKYSLIGVPETLLIPLWARATEGRYPNPILRDPWAETIIRDIAYDFSRFETSWKSQVGIAIRTSVLDRAVSSFLRGHPEAVVVNLGAGLDTRFLRLDNGKLDWFEVDLPEPIRLKKSFFQETPRYHMVCGSVLEEDWVAMIPVDRRPVLLIAEGLLMYFTEEAVRDLFRRLVSEFPGAEMLFEMMTPTLVNMGKQHDTVPRTSAASNGNGSSTPFSWGIRNGREAAAYHPGIRFIEEWNYFDFYRERWRWMGWLARIPAFKKRFNNRIVHLAFEKENA